MTACSVVVVSYHTGPVLFAAVKSILKQQQLAELIVVDNGNPPDVLARLQQMALTEPKLIVATGAGNTGFAKGCNIGAAYATGEFILLLNPDCLLPPEALADTMAALNQTPGAMAAGCWLQNPDGSEQRGGRRHLLTPRTALSESLCLHRLSKKFRRLNYHDTPMPRETHEVEAISGAFLCIRKADYQRLGGLDEKFFLHVEDLDLCMRVHKAGGKIVCVPRVQVTHMLSTSGQTTSRFIEWHKAKGFMRYFRKHFGGDIFLPLLWLLNMAVLVRFAERVTIAAVRRRVRRKRKLVHSAAAKRLMVLASSLTEAAEKKAWQGKTVLVTGATGQVGLCVIKRMLAAGASVLAISRGQPIPFRHENLRWITGDLTDKNLHLQGYLADVAVHCAPLQHLPPVLDLLAQAEVKRVIAFSSTSIFGKALSKNSYEKNLVEGLAKAEAELAAHCEKSGMQWTVLRPTLIYGIGLDINITTLAKIIDRLGCFFIYPPAFGRRQPVHADDLALAVMQAAHSPASIGKAYNVSGGEILTYHEMLLRLFAVCEKKPCIIETTLFPLLLGIAGMALRKPHINGEVARRMNDDLVFFHDDAARDFGFRPRPFLSGGIKDIEGF